KPRAPAARQAESCQHRLEHALVAECRDEFLPGQNAAQQGMGIAERARVGRRNVGFAEVLDASLEELRLAVAALAEDLAQIGIAARRAGLAGDVVEADGNGEFGPQAERRAGLALGEE